MYLVNKESLILYSILLYILIYYVVTVLIKPAFLFNEDGDIKLFGLGYMNKTIIPIWLFTLMIAILSYLFIFYLTRVNLSY